MLWFKDKHLLCGYFDGFLKLALNELLMYSICETAYEKLTCGETLYYTLKHFALL